MTNSGVAITDPIYFHVGWQKAASTTLQFDLFAQHSQICNLGKPNKSLDFYRYLLWTEVADYDVEKGREIWQQTIAPLAASGRRMLYSYENFATLPGVDRSLAALRVAEMFPQARAILVVRNQFTLLESLYTHLLVTGKIFGSFEHWLRTQSAFPYNTFVSHARFYEIFDVYRRLLGPDRVLVLLFEDLTENRSRFAAQLCDFLEIDTREAIELLAGANKRKSRPSRWNALIHQHALLAGIDQKLRPLVSIELRQHLRRLIDKRIPTSITWPKDLRKELLSYYGPGNRRLADEVDLPLDHYGYPR